MSLLCNRTLPRNNDHFSISNDQKLLTYSKITHYSRLSAACQFGLSDKSISSERVGGEEESKPLFIWLRRGRGDDAGRGAGVGEDDCDFAWFL